MCWDQCREKPQLKSADEAAPAEVKALESLTNPVCTPAPERERGREGESVSE